MVLMVLQRTCGEACLRRVRSRGVEWCLPLSAAAAAPGVALLCSTFWISRVMWAWEGGRIDADSSPFCFWSSRKHHKTDERGYRQWIDCSNWNAFEVESRRRDLCRARMTSLGRLTSAQVLRPAATPSTGQGSGVVRHANWRGSWGNLSRRQCRCLPRSSPEPRVSQDQDKCSRLPHSTTLALLLLSFLLLLISDTIAAVGH